MTTKNPHACTARSTPFPITGGDYVSDGKRLIAASEPVPKKPEPADKTDLITKPDTPAAPRGTSTKEHRHG